MRFWGLCDPGGGATGDGREGGRMGREVSWGNFRPGQVRRGVEGHRRGKDRRTGVYLPDSWVIAEKVGRSAANFGVEVPHRGGAARPQRVE